MNARERFHNTMHYKPVDRCPIMDFGFWQETLVIWQMYGLPKGDYGNSADDFFGMDAQWSSCGGATALWPSFEWKVIKDLGDKEIIRQGDGTVVERGKFMGSIPKHLDHILKDRESWNKHYKPRLDPNDPTRFGTGKEWEKKLAEWNRPDRDYPLNLGVGSLYGNQRDWFGLQRISEIIYDDRALFEEIVENAADISVAVIEKTCGEGGVRPEAAAFWEDMCYSSGPLISPKLFKEVLVPQYRRITDTLHKYGVDIIYLDCDGNIEKLMPLWLDVGVNCMFPLEIGTWGTDPIKYRGQYGKELRIMGGFDKHILARTVEEITREVERLAPLVEEGGFIPFCDHRVPPDVPLSNYVHYVNEAKRVWGKGLDNIRPTKTPDYEHAKFSEEHGGYTWDMEKLGLARIYEEDKGIVS